MYQTISETVSVSGTYACGKFYPEKLLWREHLLRIQSIHSMHEYKDGDVRKRTFALSADGNTYSLTFNRDREVWTLEQVWVEDGV